MERDECRKLMKFNYWKVCKIEMGGRGGKGGKGGNKQTPPQSANEDGGDEE